MQSEYGSNFNHRLGTAAGAMPTWYSNRRTKTQIYFPPINKTFTNGSEHKYSETAQFGKVRKESTFNTFGDLVPKGSLSGLGQANKPGNENKEKYVNLLTDLSERKRLLKSMPSGGKGDWRHIRESYGAGTRLMSWVDGLPSRTSETIPKLRDNGLGGKGPNRHITDTYGAGTSLITWINGEPPVNKADRTARFSTCVPLPTPYQLQFGPYTLVGGQRVRPELKALRD